MRFVHVADVHLDTSFSGRTPEVRARLREASRRAFRAAVDLAIREDVHALLIAGDLFDGDRLSFPTERFLLEETARLGDHGITVVYATGNHDPATVATGPRRLDWPSNVRMATDRTPQRFMIHNRDGEPVGFVTAAGHETAQETTDLSRLFPRPQGDLPEVGLLHTQVHSSLGARDHHPYAPSELTYLLRAGYDYWALGHVHIRQELSEDPPIWYPGSLQGKSHTDQGERGALLVDLSDRGSPALDFRSLAPVCWMTMEVSSLAEIATLDTLERHIQHRWTQRPREPNEDVDREWMLRIVLRGPCPLWAELRNRESLELLRDELRDLLGVLDVSVLTHGVHPVLPIGEHRMRVDVLGEALRLAEALQQGTHTLPDSGLGELLGFDPTLHGDVERYVRTVLKGVDGELAALLLEGTGA